MKWMSKGLNTRIMLKQMEAPNNFVLHGNEYFGLIMSTRLTTWGVDEGLMVEGEQGQWLRNTRGDCVVTCGREEHSS